MLVDPARARVYVEGWQSWSPSTVYRVTDRQHQPVRAVTQTMSYRPGRPPPSSGFRGEGLLAVDTGLSSVRVYAAKPHSDDVPSISAALHGDRITISSTGPIEEFAAPSLEAGLAAWADRYAAALDVPPPRPAPTAWCSWYHYFEAVTSADVFANVADIEKHDLPIDVVQIDDGWQAEIGDWLALSDRFSSLPALTERIAAGTRRAGIWVAPFLVGARSALFADHRDWLIGGPEAPVSAGHNWDQDLYALDATHPGAAAYLRSVFSWLTTVGFSYFKIDFLYAGALEGQRFSGASPLAAYRTGLGLIRAAIGDSYLLGCGAPILPSVGLVDAMRVSADIAPTYESWDGDISQPSQRGAALSTVGRAYQHGRFWVNDSDCLVARPEIERREEWAAIVERHGGLRSSSDRIASLDAWGLDTTRRLLASVPPPTPFDQ